MEKNPLTSEQIKKLQNISKLKPEEQGKVFQAFLKELNPEQVEFLKKYYVSSDSEEKQCPFCLIAQGQMKSHKIYEDEKVMAVLDIHPANKGHVIVFPKKHYSVLAQMNEEEIGYLFNIVSKLSSVIFQRLKAEGTNIFLAFGQVAGQAVPHVIVHIIPRYKDDGLDFGWESKEFDDKELEDISLDLRDGAALISAYKRVIEEKIENINEEEYNYDEERVA